MKTKLPIIFTIVLILFCSCKGSRIAHKLQEQIKKEVRSRIEDAKYRDYTPIKFSPIYSTEVTKGDALISLLAEDVTDLEIDDYLDKAEKRLEDAYGDAEYSLPRDWDRTEVAKQVASLQPLSLIMHFLLDGKISLEQYKNIIYISNVIEQNKLTPNNYVVFHSFEFKDKYGDSFDDCYVFFLDASTFAVEYMRQLDDEVIKALGLL